MNVVSIVVGMLGLFILHQFIKNKPQNKNKSVISAAGFDLFVGIDWSGAVKERQKGIQVAVATSGNAAPIIIQPPNSNGWSRVEVIDWLNKKKASGKRVLAGMDFAFAHPSSDGGYFPELGNTPETAQNLWKLVENVNAKWPHLYGGGIWGHPDLREYYNAPSCRDGRGGGGKKYKSRLRQTEHIVSSVYKRKPTSTFNCVGAGGVGTGSLAGMRLLHRMADGAWIWPFAKRDRVNVLKSEGGLLVLVEIYPALYFTMARVKDAEKKASPMDALNRGLKCFDSELVYSIAQCLPDHDDIDAVISAAALRKLHHPDDIFPIDEEHRDIASREGWIFGASSSKTTRC